jgi:hypothetical protein
METYRIHRKQALGMEEVIDQYIRSMKLAAGLNTQRVFAAWDEVSGAASATLRRYYRDGVLRVSLASSVQRFELGLQKAQMIERMNAWLLKDDLFVKDDPKVGLVKDIILK